jgi:hypothetical protein
MLGYGKEVLSKVNMLDASMSFEEESQSCILVESTRGSGMQLIEIDSEILGSSRAIPGDTTELMIEWNRCLDTMFIRPDLNVDKFNV